VSSAGDVIARYSYGPFGEYISGAKDISYSYNGEEYDPLTGLQYLRARYYDPNSGRFTTADTYPGMPTDPLSYNVYSYAENDPVNYADPSGHTRNSGPINKQVYIDKFLRLGAIRHEMEVMLRTITQTQTSSSYGEMGRFNKLRDE
jgi:RHS repeat-associated protein